MEDRTKISLNGTRIVLITERKTIKNKITELLRPEPQFMVISASTYSRSYLKILEGKHTDIVIMDTNALDDCDVEIIEKIKKSYPEVPVLVLASTENEKHLYRAVMAGVSGYLLNDYCGITLPKAIKDVLAGGATLSPLVAGRVLNMLQNRAVLPRTTVAESASDYNLTPREIEVLENIVKGLSYKMIGYELEISYNTVRAHMKNIYDKLQVSSLTEAVSKSITRHIVALPAVN